MNTIIENAIEYVNDLFAHDFSGHDVSHTLRVYHVAVKLAAEEGADVFITSLAALLHDVDDVKLSPATSEGKLNAVAFMRSQNLNDEIITAVVGIIDSISFAGSGKSVPDSTEGKCVQDADRLDAIGAVGIARAFAYGGAHGRKMYDPAEKPRTEMTETEYHSGNSTTVNHFYEKLFLLKDLMNTEAGRKEAEKRDEFMHGFIDRFLDEQKA